MIRKEIRTPQDFYPMSGTGWISFSAVAGSIHSASFIRSRTAIAGGASVFLSVRLQNKGWRIDYINATEPLRKRVKASDIYPDVKHQ